ncbi:acyltransferase family protein [Liquorilactobacillus nagelii]|uniref:acyltransferase family protein n=1 Tax=Liquorilactobacillus nagelii TaxID=82688 RepID=UPI0039E9FBEE
MVKMRDSRIELLRCVSMFLIILSHFSLYGNWIDKNEFSPSNTVKILLYNPLGIAGGVCFFIISGYFEFNKDSFEISLEKSKKRVFKTWIPTFFYSLVICLIIYFFHLNYVSKFSIVKSIFPIMFNEYWFITCYVVLILLSPYLNLVLKKLSKNYYRKFILLLFVFQIAALLENNIFNQFLIALTSYAIGFYLRKYDVYVKEKLLLLYFTLVYSLGLLSIYISKLIGLPFKSTSHFLPYILTVCLGTIMFLVFHELKPFESKIVNNISTKVFAVYIITEHPQFRNILWSQIINTKQYQNSILFPLQGILICFCIFITCIFIDSIKNNIFSLFLKKLNYKN